MISAPSASAVKPKPKPPDALLQPRSCIGLLSFDEFPQAVEENEFLPGSWKVDSIEKSKTVCAFWTTLLSEEEPVGGFPHPRENVGLDTLVVYDRAGVEKHPNLITSNPTFRIGGPYRLARNIGTYAYWRFNSSTGTSEVELQVRNDVFTASEFDGVPGYVLSKVAHELSPSGR